MRPRSARNAAQCIFFIFKEIPKSSYTAGACGRNVAGACHNSRGGEREGRKEWEGRGQGLRDFIALSPSIGGPPPGPIKPPELKLAASAV